MDLLTYTEIKSRLQNRYDISDERFVTEAELLEYINDAIDNAEAAIHNLHYEDKWFLQPGTITLVNGTQDYALPSDIYGNKLRLVFYNNGSLKYRIHRIKNLEETQYAQSGDRYKFLLVNDSTNGMRLRLYPTPAESGAYVPLWYVRNMRRMTTSSASTNTCEVPESHNFVIQHVRHQLAIKMRNPTLIAEEDKERLVQYNLMLENLIQMTADEENQLPMDLRAYYDQFQELDQW